MQLQNTMLSMQTQYRINMKRKTSVIFYNCCCSIIRKSFYDKKKKSNSSALFTVMWNFLQKNSFQGITISL